MLAQLSPRHTMVATAKHDGGAGDPEEDNDSVGDVDGDALHYEECMLRGEGGMVDSRRHGDLEAITFGTKSRGLAGVPGLRLPRHRSPSRRRAEEGDDDWGVRKTPRRVPIRPSTAGKNRMRRGGVGDGVGKGSSPRMNKGHLVSSESLSAR